MEKQGKIFILSGPSGCGKGTVLKSAMREHPDMFLSVSATTRGPRQGEIDGVHYHFIDDDAFLKMIDRDQLLEHAGYAGNFYGTPRIPRGRGPGSGPGRDAGDRRAGGPAGLCQAARRRAHLPGSALLVGAGAPPGEPGHRLRRQDSPAADRARDEMALAVDYDYFIINDDVERAAAELNDIFRVEHFKPAERMHLVKD